MSLLYIGQEITIYGGIFLVAAGLVGNGMNIYVFSSIRTYRKAPCAFYFLIASIFNILYIAINLISRIVGTGFGIDLTQTSTSWCKIREFCLFTLSLITLTCSCLATIDQFFVTSRNVNLRRLSNIKWAHRIVFIVILVWCIHGIAPLVFFDISPVSKTCININAGFDVYIRVYLLGLICVIPVAVMVLFGFLIYGNIRQTGVLQRQLADRQMTKMIFIEVLLIVISICPYGIYIAYGLVTAGISKDQNQLIEESFALTIFSLLPYFYYAGSCYMFLISSSRFRRAVRDRIFRCRKPNQINPTQQSSFQRTKN